ncbi:MAG: molybdopterin-synthase adenylyltransferase MoeB [Pseudomonadales bacterium]|jgi:molybdopterin/thiamine biosynthesis adenylyltransferase|nr:molybdopterin-synthase adenylyltransferase MoeB [Pseudomonadales bacterium]
MNDEELLRYSRHILLPELDVAGQQKLLDASMLVVGLGGLGSPVALYLGASGVGRLVLADDDRVELSNLQRQVIHATARVGQGKAVSAAASLQALNPGVRTEVVAQRIDAAGLDRLVPAVSVVLDCSDNSATRRAINAACRRHRVPLVSAAALGWEGQLAVFDARVAGSACYQCLYPGGVGEDATSCAHNGIAAPVVGAMGVLQALQALKLVTGAGEVVAGELLVFDGLALDFHRLRVRPRPDCPVCASVPVGPDSSGQQAGQMSG